MFLLELGGNIMRDRERLGLKAAFRELANRFGFVGACLIILALIALLSFLLATREAWVVAYLPKNIWKLM